MFLAVAEKLKYMVMIGREQARDSRGSLVRWYSDTYRSVSAPLLPASQFSQKPQDPRLCSVLTSVSWGFINDGPSITHIEHITQRASLASFDPYPAMVSVFSQSRDRLLLLLLAVFLSLVLLYV